MASTRRSLQGFGVPNDIWECVIDQCAYDKRLLVRCCLTCRAWERRSRYWLEVAKQRRLLYLSSKDELDTIVAEVSREPHLGSYVEMISICRRMIFSSDDSSSSPWYHTFPLRLASKLPNVRELILDSKVDTSKMLSSSISLLRTFRSIDRIVLSECRFGTFTDFIRLLLFFPQLVDLKLTDITWTSQHNLAHLLGKARSKNFRLRCLTADATRHPEFVTPFMAWLETTPSRDSLEELHLRLHGDGAFHGVATFFKAGAQNLREVSFNVVRGRIAGMHSDAQCVFYLALSFWSCGDLFDFRNQRYTFKTCPLFTLSRSRDQE